MSGKEQIAVPAETLPVRIDAFLASRFSELSRSRIQQLIAEKLVTCNGGPVKASSKIQPGDLLEISIPPPRETEILPEDIPLDIIHEDGDIAVINKQAGLSVHPSGGIVSGTLVNALLYHIRDLSGINGVLRPGIVHRLDKNTTGVIVIAKNDRSHRHLARQFEERTTAKKYRALCWGLFDSPEGTVEKSIERSRKDRKKMISGTSGKRSLTEYSVLKEYGFMSLVEARPKTGRTHQIRSHFASIGHPVFGDELYRGRTRRLAGLPKRALDCAAQLLKNFHRQALHAAEISFIHPNTEKPAFFSAPIPDDMRTLIDTLDTFIAGD